MNRKSIFICLITLLIISRFILLSNILPVFHVDQNPTEIVRSDIFGDF